MYTIIGQDPETGEVTLSVECRYHETSTSFTKTVTDDQYDEIVSSQKFFAQIFADDPKWTLADIELFFISGMCDDCWKKMCSEEDLEELDAAEKAWLQHKGLY